ncbi:MAG: sulfur carrier protein ThiS [Cytophagaceae bacterium]
MMIFINNEKKEVETGNKLSKLLEQLNLLQKRGIAIAINNEVIPKVEWDSQPLQDGDKITIITATQGG